MQPRPVENKHGGLWIFEPPKEGVRYAAGVDTGEGITGGDWSVMAVIEIETCDLVAGWKCLMAPDQWGRKCALLGDYFNEAFICFEVNAHGLTSVLEAVSAGYRQLYTRRRDQHRNREFTQLLGWQTHWKTKPRMIDMIRKALFDPDIKIPDPRLIKELQGIHLNEAGKYGKKDHDDYHDAYSLALIARQEMYVQGIDQPPPKKRLHRPSSEKFLLEDERPAKRQSTLTNLGGM